jgi:spermidine/putrescine transport system substrate-binding protein
MVHSRRMFLRQAGLAGIGLSFTGALGLFARQAGPRAQPLHLGHLYRENTVADFTKAAGAGVNISLFANNDELLPSCAAATRAMT